MPAMLEDPTAAPIYRVSGDPPYPMPYGQLPADISLRHVTLRDRLTIATILPFSSPHQVPHKLMACLCEALNREIEKGDTYPMMDPMALEAFSTYWFQNFGALMILGDVQSAEELMQMEERGADWSKECLGSFYVRPNYPGRSSHVCNGGFLVTDAARNRGVGRLMGEVYLDWAPKLGYTYSIFNLVYETNVASLRIWDGLGFKRIGRIKGCGNLKSFPDQYVDALMFGRELGGEGDEYVSEERFDKIRFYLKTGTYPNGSDRAEKSRLRSAATHYRLVPNQPGDESEEKLMLKGKEVVSDPHKQYEIARAVHAQSHGGINKTTASIAEKYHWVRIKETVSAAIRNCTECKESGPKPAQQTGGREKSTYDPTPSRPRASRGASQHQNQQQQQLQQHPNAMQNQVMAGAPNTDPSKAVYPPPQQPQAPMANMQYHPTSYGDMPVDPQIMQSMHHWGQNAAHHSQPMVLDGPTQAQMQVQAQQGQSEADAETRLREELEAQIMHENHQAYRDGH